MRILKYSSRFKKDLKKVSKNKSFDEKVFSSVVETLRSGRRLHEKYRNHKLHGEFRECFECHLNPNVLLIYRIDIEDQILHLLRIGSHPDLFG